MHRSVKKDWDYRELHTSGIKVVKPVSMSDIVRLKQQNLDCIDDLDEFIEDHNVQEFDHIDEADEQLKVVSIFIANFKKSHSELKIALGDQYDDGAEEKRKHYTERYRRYTRDIGTRRRELVRLRQVFDHEKNLEVENLKLVSALEVEKLKLVSEQKTRDFALEVEKLKLVSEEKSRDRDRELAAENKYHDRELATEEKSREIETNLELEKLKLESRDREFEKNLELEEKKLLLEEKKFQLEEQRAADERTHKNELETIRLETSAGLALEALRTSEASLPVNLSVSEIEREKAEMVLQYEKFRMAHADLSLGDRYGDDQKRLLSSVSEKVQNKISGLTHSIRIKQETQGNLVHKERELECDSKRVLGEQTAKEIHMRCSALNSKCGVTLTTLPDSQLLDLNKELFQLDNDASKILETVTKYSRIAGGSDMSDRLINLNDLLVNTIDMKEKFVLAVRREVKDRDLSEEKIKNALGLKVRIPKFTGYESPMDIYTFQTQFLKLVYPYVQKPLLSDTLKYNYLGDPALTMVKELIDIDKIWERLIKSYGDSRVLLQNKLGGLSKMGGLDKIRGKEKLIIGISELVNAMAELSRLAKMYKLESRLYHPMGGLGKVRELMGQSRVLRYEKRVYKRALNDQEMWDEIVQFLEEELELTRFSVVNEKSGQPICSAKTNPEKPKNPDKFENNEGLGWKNKFSNVSMNEEKEGICNICGKKGHKTYVSPFSGHRKVSYLACDKFLGLSPRERCKILDDKGFCRRCMSSGVKKDHKNCPTTYMCQNSSHDSNSEGYHVLVCEQHKNTPENAKLLKKFKEEFIQKFEESLPSTSKNVKITMHSKANCASIASEEGEASNKGIFMLQTIIVQGESFNLFYDSGCGDLVCKKSAIDKLISLGKASRELSGPITLSGVGDKKTVCQDGIFKINLPLTTGKDAIMSGLCLDKVTGKFPVFSLETVENDIKVHYLNGGQDPDDLPCLPGKVGGETDIMIGIKYLKYFPKEIHKLPNGLTIYEAMFENSDGSLGVVAGPHPSFSDDWEKMGQVAYSYEVMPEVAQYQYIHQIGMEVPLLGWWENLENPDHNPKPTPTTIACADVLTSRRAPKISQIFDKLENAGTEITYRCKDCRECPECKKSDRFESISIQEEIEQTIIEKSVNVDISKGRTIAKLPFLSNPVHKLRPNRGIALRVYQSQLKKLRKNAMDMDQVLKSENKLHDLGFVDFVENLCDEDRNMILNSEDKNFIPWRAVWNLNSLSTPCRLVFDASQTTKNSCSLNDILAKGTNNMNKLVEIFIRWSIRASAFHTDIQKMYNAVELDRSHWKYQLYLWSNSFDIAEPKLKVIKTLIYGVKSSGNQAECGLRKTAKKSETGHERACEVVHKDIYVDDCISGDEGIDQVHVLTDDLENMLKKGGFYLKGITFSGSNPPDHLSEDGESILVGGLRWFSKTDQLKLNLGDFNFNKKLRGRKAQDELGTIPENFTRRDCVSKVSEVFDPLGKVSPIIGGMKIDLHELISRNLDWDDPIPCDLKDLWLKNFETIQGLRDVTFNRAIVPSNAKSLKICTLDTADASNQLICVAIYARFLLTDGGYSCQLVFARTKIVPRDMSVPRAELLAATLNATSGHVVKTSFGKYFEKSMKLTDSQIALFWINSTRSELKLWARNRVIEINRLTEINSWRYVKSCDMIADLGTRKGAQIKDMNQSGDWVCGKPWMRLPESEFPVSTVSDITLCSADRSEASNECNTPNVTDQICSVNSWCYAHNGVFSRDAVPHQVKTRYESSKYVIDPNRFRLRKIVRILGIVYLFVQKCYSACGFIGRLRKHPKVTLDIVPAILSCEGDQYIVTTGSQDGGSPFCCPAGWVVRVSNNEIKLALTYLFRKATEEVKKYINTRSYDSISSEIEGILYYTGRILPSMEERVGPQMSDVMFDLSKTTFCVPITDKHSPIAYSIVNEVHSHHPDVKHLGVETILRHVQLVAHVIGGRELVKKYAKYCTRCKILNKNVVKVIMGPLHEGQLKVAPAFYRTQVDLFGPFNSYDLTSKRKTIKIWFVIFCCISTSAIDIKVLEDYSTEAFLLAFVRFACRVGFPKLLLPDEGSQLVKGCKTMILTYTDIKNKLYTDFGVEFEVCPVGAHYMHGKVERKIRQVKKSITINMESNRLSVLQWESLVAQVANGINNLPLGLGNKVECLEDLDIITPNRLLLGRNNNRCPSGPLTALESFKRILDTNKEIYDTWFRSWLKSYVPTLIDRPKWLTSNNEVKVGDVVLFLKSEKEFERDYQYGIIHTVNLGRDGHIRVVEVEYQNHNEGVKRYTTRGVRDLVVIHPVDEPGIDAELAEIGQ